MGLVYNAFLPAPVDSDVVTRKLKIVVDGVTAVLTVNPQTTVYELPPVKDGASIELSICDIDDAGNESGYNEPLKFTAVDTIVPAVPGAVNVKIVKEVADPVVVEAEVVVKPAAPPAPAPVDDDEEDTVNVPPALQPFLGMKKFELV